MAKFGVTYPAMNGCVKTSPPALKQVEDLALGLGKRGIQRHIRFLQISQPRGNPPARLCAHPWPLRRCGRYRRR